LTKPISKNLLVPFYSAAYLSTFTKCLSYLVAKILYVAHLPAQDVVIELCSDELSAGNLPNMLAELLKSVGYNHAPFYLGTWGLILRGELVWYVQVALYEKDLSFGVLMIRHTYYATSSASFNDGI
jgi:hypothetical protein